MVIYYFLKRWLHLERGLSFHLQPLFVSAIIFLMKRIELIFSFFIWARDFLSEIWFWKSSRCGDKSPVFSKCSWLTSASLRRTWRSRKRIATFFSTSSVPMSRASRKLNPLQKPNAILTKNKGVAFFVTPSITVSSCVQPTDFRQPDCVVRSDSLGMNRTRSYLTHAISHLEDRLMIERSKLPGERWKRFLHVLSYCVWHWKLLLFAQELLERRTIRTRRWANRPVLLL